MSQRGTSRIQRDAPIRLGRTDRSCAQVATNNRSTTTCRSSAWRRGGTRVWRAPARRSSSCRWGTHRRLRPPQGSGACAACEGLDGLPQRTLHLPWRPRGPSGACAAPGPASRSLRGPVLSARSARGAGAGPLAEAAGPPRSAHCLLRLRRRCRQCWQLRRVHLS